MRSLFHVSTKSEVAVKVLVGKCCIPMSAFALFSSRECSFLEVQFDKRLPQREAEHLGPYCPIPHRAKRYTWLWTLCIWTGEEFCNLGLSWFHFAWHLLFVRFDAVFHCWAPRVLLWLTCVITPVQDHLLVLTSLIYCEYPHHHFLCQLLPLTVCPPFHGVGRQQLESKAKRTGPVNSFITLMT